MNTNKAKVIDAAYGKGQVSPKKMNIYMIAFLIGLIIPVGFVYLKFLLDNKVHNRKDIEEVVKVTFLGDIPENPKDNNDLKSKTSRSSTAEFLRILQTNLEFMLTGVESHLAKTICVTSTIPKEGKTFVTSHLAITLSHYDKKVLLIGLDLRKPKIDDYFNVNSDMGITNFLIKSDKPIEDYIQKDAEVPNLDIIPSGLIPPNPTELLMSKKLEETIAYLKTKYDYIFIDTAPTSLVTDTFLINKLSDVFLYVVRAHYLPKDMLSICKNLHDEKKLSNMAIVLNRTDYRKVYGYGYGYGHDLKKQTFKEKMRILFKI